ncbi:unnamed protein product [Polarella glacialis]|uniref:SCP domain-containing protein n=1 Tax=Polarella glacialis TaxID=89957 RepID=A0A813KQW8_POLGL|nr:unnamed protein product [Polarella glacialis]
MAMPPLEFHLRSSSVLICILSCFVGASTLDTDMQAALDLHNVYRCMHGVPLLVWDADIAANAQAWAINGHYKQSSSASRVVKGEQCGENLAWGNDAGMSGERSTRLWYSEIKYTNPSAYGTAANMTDSYPSGNAIGHYTQMIWDSSTKLGCGMGTAIMSGIWGDYLVCQHGPAGNHVGSYATQIVAPSVSLATCGGNSADFPINYPSYLTGGSSSSTSTTVAATSLVNTTPAPLPSACFPSVLLPVGGLCVYGYQCESMFCCPRMKVCLASSSGIVTSTDIKVYAGMRRTVMGFVFFDGTCKDPWSNSSMCEQDSYGQPFSDWNQSACQCSEEYMTRYNAGTWVTLNAIPGFTCTATTTTTKTTTRTTTRTTTVTVTTAVASGAPRATLLLLFWTITFGFTSSLEQLGCCDPV